MRRTAALPRRLAALACLASALFAATPLAADVRAWNFRVLLDDSEIGFHRFTLRQQAGERELTSEARFDVKLLFVSAYRYAHDATERWRDDCLVAVNARTDDNGDRHRVAAARAGERLVVETDKGRDDLGGCVMTFAYWNPQMLRQTRLLNAQTGEYLDVNIAARGRETIAVRGAPVEARRYAVRGPGLAIDLWYSADGYDWLALESVTDGGRRLRYLIN
jgi:hypothetical protein